jgi:hypothetical protein
MAVALLGWSAVVALSARDGVFARVGTMPFAWLAAFAVGFALATYGLDAGVRAWIGRAPTRVLVAMAAAIDVALAAAAWELLDAGEGWPRLLATLHGPMLVLVAAPMALPLHLAAARSWARRTLSSGAGRSPGASPAAT